MVFSKQRSFKEKKTELSSLSVSGNIPPTICGTFGKRALYLLYILHMHSNAIKSSLDSFNKKSANCCYADFGQSVANCHHWNICSPNPRYLGRFEAGDNFNLVIMTFFWTRDVLRLGSFEAWDVLRIGTFCSWDI